MLTSMCLVDAQKSHLCQSPATILHRAISDIVEDLVSCADELDGGKSDARVYCAELIAALSSPAPRQLDPRLVSLLSAASHVAGYLAPDNPEMSDKLWTAVCAITNEPLPSPPQDDERGAQK